MENYVNNNICVMKSSKSQHSIGYIYVRQVLFNKYEESIDALIIIKYGTQFCNTLQNSKGDRKNNSLQNIYFEHPSIWKCGYHQTVEHYSRVKRTNQLYNADMAPKNWQNKMSITRPSIFLVFVMIES